MVYHLYWGDSDDASKYPNVDLEKVAERLDDLSAECWKNPPEGEALFEKQSSWKRSKKVSKAYKKFVQAVGRLELTKASIAAKAAKQAAEKRQSSQQ